MDSFEADRRNVKPIVVDYVMRHFIEGTGVVQPDVTDSENPPLQTVSPTSSTDLVCEEILLEAGIDEDT